MGNPALLPIQKEGVLRIFIDFKNSSPWLSSNLQPLGPVASTLTTTPPRRLLSVTQKNNTDFGRKQKIKSTLTHKNQLHFSAMFTQLEYIGFQPQFTVFGLLLEFWLPRSVLFS
jgi:hypothetical protein